MSYTLKLTPVTSMAYGINNIPVICNSFIAKCAGILPDCIELTIVKIGEDEPKFDGEDIHIADFELLHTCVIIHGASSPTMVYGALVVFFGLAVHNHYRATFKVVEP